MSIHQSELHSVDPQKCPLRRSELHLLEMISQGHLIKQVAPRLRCSENTVNRMIADMKRITGKQTPAGLVAMALRNGWIQ